ncbi:DoxX family protein [Spirillospora sp. CA-294931]|uniref:DoxX family protein n=1 Tax=Spirillospora sp. CA-294931 TaxID=3240042 RepID=UPI003D945099
MTAQQPVPQAPASGRGRSAEIAVWTAQIVLGLFMIVASGLPKLYGQATAVELFDDIGWGDWFRYFTGVVEIAGGVGLLIPRLAAPAAVGLIGVMIGAVITNVALDTPAWTLLPIVYAALLVVIARRRWSQATPLLRFGR